MDSEIQQQVLDGISAMAQGLQTTSAHLYEVLVKQTVVEGILGVIYAVFILGLFIALCTKGVELVVWMTKRNEEEQAKNKYHDGYGVMAVITSIVGICIVPLLIFLFFTSVGDAVTGFVNPEFGAIERVADYLNIHQNNGTK